MTTEEVIALIETVKQPAAGLPAPANLAIVGGLTLAELVIAHVEEERRADVFEQLNALVRAGMKASVQAELDARFPNG